MKGQTVLTLSQGGTDSIARNARARRRKVNAVKWRLRLLIGCEAPLGVGGK
ncbi:MAG: hypothetical protein JKY66_11195 [Spongiibacteraceae bacterium]|nr:hypothetical protein [Spongiibacteraceae bacterium]